MCPDVFCLEGGTTDLDVLNAVNFRYNKQLDVTMQRQFMYFKDMFQL